ncbi:MAG: M1 family aminopeptidase, partial [Deltaproteobacteria bacterium]|nr:M1 family aminopeptidase [Deltaproteobacteria bacterium]
ERVYGLTLPQPNINLVQTEGPPDVIRTVGQTVLIPKGYYQNSRLLDRLYVGFLSSALARMWFGSTVWADENREAWLSYGLSGYFSLEYFDSLYGFDAPIHTITDWLAPRYREHYFEDPVRDLLRSETDSPLAATWEDNPHQQALRVATHNKAPLVFRSLAYVMGKENFIRTLQDYYRKNRFRSVHRKTFEQEAALHSVQPLGWYFSQWVDGTVPMDYALVDWEEERASLGYQITVTVARLKPGVMPVMVMVESTSGQKVTQTWNGRGDQTRLTFLLDQPLARVVLDPYEFLLETDRKNNFSAANLRFRPFFDWAKDREVLVSIQGRMGGNAVDGNHVGLGASFTVGQDDDIFVIPGTGDKSHDLLYSVGWTHNRLFNPNLSFFLKGDRYGGQETQQTGFSYSFPLPDRFALSTSLSYAPQLINLADPRIPDAKPIIRRANHINFSERFSYQTPGYLWFGLDVSMEHSQEGLNSDLHYTITKGVFNQTYPLSSSHIVDFDIIRATTYGETPLVKKHLLGDPSVLRGYPRVLDLLYDDLAAMRLDYRWVFSRAIWGTEFQSRKWTLILSADAGKGWNHHESYELAPTRQNVAIGFELDVNVLSHLTFPIRVEFARPVNDPDYNKTQYIFFQALSFF